MSMTDQEKIDVIQAQVDGKAIERHDKSGRRGWSGRQDHGYAFNFAQYDYRIKSIEYVEITIAEAFQLLASGCKVMCQVSDGGWWGCQQELSGANKDRSLFHIGSGYSWTHCRVTKEVYDAR